MIHTVYLFYDAQGTLLYVGRSRAVTSRCNDHQRTKDWWPEVAAATFEHYSTAADAIARERELIQELTPLHNVMFTRPPADPGPVLARRLVA